MKQKTARNRQFWTIPNILTLLRFALIPLILWLYIVPQKYLTAAVIVGISGLTDVVDGIIARKFNMITDIGKIIDPIADKLTQATVIFCLSLRYNTMIALFVAHVIKELVMGVMGLVALKNHSINGARWYGKLNTVVLFFVIIIHLIIPNVSEAFSLCLVTVSISIMAMALIMYIRFYYQILSQKG